jgi:hypothetical protein
MKKSKLKPSQHKRKQAEPDESEPSSKRQRFLCPLFSPFGFFCDFLCVSSRIVWSKLLMTKVCWILFVCSLPFVIHFLDSSRSHHSHQTGVTGGPLLRPGRPGCGLSHWFAALLLALFLLPQLTPIFLLFSLLVSFSLPTCRRHFRFGDLRHSVEPGVQRHRRHRPQHRQGRICLTEHQRLLFTAFCQTLLSTTTEHPCSSSQLLS